MNPIEKTPKHFDYNDWNNFMKMAVYPYYETFAKILFAQGKTNSALCYLEKALQNRNIENLIPEEAQLYTSLLVAEHQNEKAYQLLLRNVELGKATDVMIAQFRKLYTQLTGKDADLVMDSIQKNVNSRYVQEVSKTMITGRQAFNFNLKTLNGSSVSLESLRGKVVVLDFWATWCIPCVKSLPMMNKLREKNRDVVFLFIVTGEDGSEAVKRINDFMKKHQFNFTVLMDEPEKNNPKRFVAVSNYKVTGIPTKVVIDKKGTLRFFSTGFTSENEFINELQAMIEVTKVQ